MTSLSDTLTVGLVLVLLFGSIALYLYTRIQQAEQKISLLESILLDMKMSSEIQSYSELPAATAAVVSNHLDEHVSPETYRPFTADDDVQDTNDESTEVEQYKSAIEDAVNTTQNDAHDFNAHMNENDATEANVTKENEEKQKQEQETKSTINYEAMSLKELHSLGKSRGVEGASSMKKAVIIDALKKADKPVVEPGTTGSSGSFLDTSGLFSNSNQ